MNIVVTGSRGQIGKSIVTQLKKDHTIIGLNSQLHDDNCHYSKTVDISNYSEVSKFFSEYSDIHCIIHLAAKANPKPNDEIKSKIIDVNVKGTQNLLECCQEYTQFIFSSSVVVYDERFLQAYARVGDALKPQSLYGITKKMGEDLVEYYGSVKNLDTTIMRLCSVVSNNLTHGIVYDFIRKLKSDSTTLDVYGKSPGTVKPFIHTDDVYNVIHHYLQNEYRSASRQHDILNVCNSDPISVKEIAEIVMEGMGIYKEINWSQDTWAGDNHLLSCSDYDMRKLGLTPTTSKEAIIKSVKSYVK